MVYTGHGGIGNPSNGYKRLENFYESYPIDNIPNRYKEQTPYTTGYNYLTFKTDKTGEFYQPFAGCSSDHTYPYFLQEINDNYHVYFYAPNFPQGNTYQEIVDAAVEEDFAYYTTEEIEQIAENYNYRIINRTANCDWREIIFQMALDYRRHNHDDDFSLKLRENNGKNKEDQ